MLKKIIFIILIAVFFTYLINYSEAQVQQPTQQKYYCCCSADKTLKESPEQVQSCPAGFTKKESNALEQCSAICGVPVPPEIPSSCTDIAYNPNPSIISITPVRGTNSLKLAFNLECPNSIKQIKIKRCRNNPSEKDCDTSIQKEIDVIPTLNEYIDQNNIEFGVDYNYVIDAVYLNDKSKSSDKAIGNAGDIECWDRLNDQPFCIFQSTYDSSKLKPYFSNNGYKLMTKLEYLNLNLKYSILDFLFSQNYNKAWKCNELNRKIPTSPKTECDSSKNEFCFISASGPRCAKKSECSEGAGPFGLFYSKTICESKDYCYSDKSKTIINSCYPCSENSEMECYDYKSRDSCESKRCGPNSCQWKEIYPSIGNGVCIDKNKDNCNNCDLKGFSKNSADVFNNLFDSCSAEKAYSLSTQQYKCLFDAKDRKALSCQKATCKDYKSKQDCNPSDAKIELDNSNRIVSKSNDFCNIGVCEYASGDCYKNSDGQRNIDQARDCKPFDDACEKDFFPPQTFITETKNRGATSSLYLRILDKTEKTTEQSANKKYNAFLCFNNTADGCSTAKDFNAITSSSQIIINNGNVFELGSKPQKNLATLGEGKYTLRYYSQDEYKNLEEVKEIIIESCTDCQGPAIIYFNLTNSNLYGNIYYTKEKKPSIELSFANPAKIYYARIVAPGKQAIEYQKPEDYRTSFVLDLQESELKEGDYWFYIQAIDKKGLYMDSQGEFKIKIDQQSPSLEIQPINLSVHNKDVNARLTLNELGLIKNARLEKENYLSKYTIQTEIEDVKHLFSQEPKKDFTIFFKNLEDGRYTLIVDATDLAGNQASNSTTFFSTTEQNKIILKNPRFGTTKEEQFNIIIQTTKKSDCRYSLDNKISKTEFGEMLQLQTTEDSGFTHFTNNFNLIKKPDEQHILYVYCKEGKEISEENFILMRDTSAPEILTVFANPDTLITPSIPGREIYITNLTAVLNEPGFCTYTKKKAGALIESGNFFEYNIIPKKISSTQANATEEGIYEFEISCKNTAEIPAQKTKSTLFTVNKTVPLQVTKIMPSAFNQSSINLAIKTNKKSQCYYGENQNVIINPIGPLGEIHSANISVKQGFANYSVSCTTPYGEVQTTQIEILVDATPPENVSTKIITDNIKEPSIYYFTGSLKANFSADDKESGVKGFYYSIEKNGKQATDFAFTESKSGELFYISINNTFDFELANGSEYSLKAKAVNNLGLQSNYTSSNKVKIITSVQPLQCNNNLSDKEESGTDCGGICQPCKLNSTCEKNSDCESGFCSTERKCEENKNPDICDAVKCPPISKCSDGKISSETKETDIDCGGECTSKCAESQNCIKDSDCDIGFICSDNQCTKKTTPQPITNKTQPPINKTVKPSPAGEAKTPWIKYILIFVILVSLAYGGFYAYKTFVKKSEEEKPPSISGLGPLPRQIEIPKVERRLQKQFIRPMRPIRIPIIPPKIKPKITIPKKEDVFEKLKKFQKPKKKKQLTKPDIFEKLRKHLPKK